MGVTRIPQEQAARIREELRQFDTMDHPVVLGWEALARRPQTDTLGMFWQGVMHSLSDESCRTSTIGPGITENASTDGTKKHSAEYVTFTTKAEEPQSLMPYASPMVHQALAKVEPEQWARYVTSFRQGSGVFVAKMLRQKRFEEVELWLRMAYKTNDVQAGENQIISVMDAMFFACRDWTNGDAKMFVSMVNRMAKDGLMSKNMEHAHVKPLGENKLRAYLMPPKKIEMVITILKATGCYNREIFKDTLLQVSKTETVEDLKKLLAHESEEVLMGVMRDAPVLFKNLLKRKSKNIHQWGEVLRPYMKKIKIDAVSVGDFMGAIMGESTTSPNAQWGPARERQNFVNDKEQVHTLFLAVESFFGDHYSFNMTVKEGATTREVSELLDMLEMKRVSLGVDVESKPSPRKRVL